MLAFVLAGCTGSAGRVGQPSDTGIADTLVDDSQPDPAPELGIVATDSTPWYEGTPCAEAADCPVEYVCEKRSGTCVACVVNAQCPEKETCWGDHHCHPVVPCNGDADCSPFGMLCDPDVHACVECLSVADCAGGVHCDSQSGYCLDAWCPHQQEDCRDGHLVWCDEALGWIAQQPCGDAQACQDGICVDQLCEPGAWFCLDEVTEAVCSEDGLEYFDTACEEGTACDDGECTDLPG